MITNKTCQNRRRFDIVHRMQPEHRIIVGIDMKHPSARLQISGILRFAAKHPEWDVQLQNCHPSDESINDDSKWIPDGVILDELSYSTIGTRVFRRKSIRAAVFTNFTPTGSIAIPHATVTTDERGIAFAAADLLCKRGLRNFAFVGSRRDETWSTARMRFFKSALAAKGFPLKVYETPKRNPNGRKHLLDWLMSLPRPCGLFVAFDQRAKYIIDLCRPSGILIPEHLQILGVDNDETICENTRPTLSSVAPDFERCGYEAAAALHALFKRRTSTAKELKIPVKETVERMSTTDIANSAGRIERARDYIRTHAFTSISPISVATAIGGSLRLLEMNFKKVTGHTIHEEIVRHRLERVKVLLTTTTHTFDTVAALSGFHNTNHLRNVFKAKFGKTLTEWRNQPRLKQTKP